MTENISLEFSTQIKVEREMEILDISFQCKKLPADCTLLNGHNYHSLHSTQSCYISVQKKLCIAECLSPDITIKFFCPQLRREQGSANIIMF